MDNAAVPSGGARHVAVIGGGIAGLAVAHRLVTDLPEASRPRVTLFEGGPRLGGKLAVSSVAGLPVDEGAEAMLARRDEGIELARAVGLDSQLVHPGTAKASILSRGALRPIPAGQLQGVPGDLAALAASGVLSAAGVARAGRERELPAPPIDADVTVSDHIAARFGAEVVDRLVEPLLGGVYAGRADALSLAATLPAVFAMARAGGSLTDAVRAATARAVAPAAHPGPVFAGLIGGLGTLPAAVAEVLARNGVELCTSATVRELIRDPSGWQLTVGSAHAPRRVSADAVVVAVPARPAARLLAAVAPGAAAALVEVHYASMAIVTLAYPAAAFDHPPAGSGYLVPAVERDATQASDRPVKAVTYVTTKWPHLAGEAARAAGEPLVIVRCSIGRYGEELMLHRGDEELVALAGAELARTSGLRGGPIDWRVSRWGGGLPQYAVGHLDLVAGIRRDVASVPGLAVCGAAYDGVGVPACVASARRAATLIAEHLDAARQ